MKEEHANYKLLAKYYFDKCSTEEKAIIEKWIAASEGNSKVYDNLCRLLKETPLTDEDINIDQLWNMLVIEPDETTENRTVNQWYKKNKFKAYKIVAILALLIAILLYFFSPGKIIENHNQNIFQADRSGISEFYLTDSLYVMLDRGSSFIYEADRDEINDLNGEVFFELNKSDSDTIVISSNSSIVKTNKAEFNIRSWNGKETIELYVLRGKVLVSNKNTPEPYNLLQSEYISLDTLGNVIEFSNKGNFNKLDWQNGSSYYKNVTLSDLVSHLKRWYGINPVFQNLDPNKVRLSIKIKHSSLEENLNLISAICGLHYKLESKSNLIFTK